MIQCTMNGNNICVPTKLLCDGFVDCQEYGNCGRDGRSSKNCTQDEFWCYLNRTCISYSKVCDNQEDCTGAEDELFCSGMFSGLEHEIISQWVVTLVVATPRQ